MKLRTCKKCGTEYDMNEVKCPICGDHNGSGGKDAKKVSDKEPVPKWGWVVSAWITGIAVLIGIVAIVIRMGYFTDEFNFSGEEYLYTVEDVEAMEAAKNGGLTVETEDEVNPALCSDLIISQDRITLSEVGDRAFLNAVARPATCEEEITYASSDEDVITVSASGMIMAEGPGEAEVIVSCGNVSVTCAVTCDFAQPEEEIEESQETEETEETVEAEETEETTEEQTEPEQLQPEVKPADFTLHFPGEEAQLNVTNVPDGAPVSYVSSNASVVTVTDSGKVKAVGNGQATITVTVGDVKLTCIARCNLSSTAEGTGDATPESSYTGPFKLSHTDVTLVNGETFKIVLMDATGKAASGLTWTTSNTGVCTVSGNTVKAVGKGQANVSVTYGGTTYSCIVRCN